MSHEIIITDAEAATVGVTHGSLNWAPKIVPLLRAKGVPEDCLEIGNPRLRWLRREADHNVFQVFDA